MGTFVPDLVLDPDEGYRQAEAAVREAAAAEQEAERTRPSGRRCTAGRTASPADAGNLTLAGVARAPRSLVTTLRRRGSASPMRRFDDD